ncbi:hypothetical protein HMI56_000838 [Coelomomyces lativittatus]|nr:hypothetical protein HMI56_000838 [Coelomomyces lativittatus]
MRQLNWNSFTSAGPLAIHIGVPLAGGFLSSMTMGNSVKTWYRTQLKKHPWTPPRMYQKEKKKKRKKKERVFLCQNVTFKNLLIIIMKEKHKFDCFFSYY